VVRDGAQALYRSLLETEIATNEKIEVGFCVPVCSLIILSSDE
jgi:hypothetical protein